MGEYLPSEHPHQSRSSVSRVLRELFVEDQRNYRDSSSGAIITSELSPSNGLQNECEVMAEAAEVMDQMADTS